MTKLQNQVYEILASVLEVNKKEIRPNSTWADYNADSLDVVELVLALEDHFQLSFETGELKSIRTVGELVAAVERKVQSG